MFPEPVFWLLLLLKMGLTASLVVLSTVIAERAGPVFGALVATLPVSAGPAYVFIALNHDAAFVAEGALASFAVNVVAAVFALVYAALAQRQGWVASLLTALAVWLVLVLMVNAIAWTTLTAIVVNVIGLAACMVVANRFRHARVPLVTRRWTDLLVRAAMVALLVAAVVTASEVLGAKATGILAVFPIVLSSLILILHPRIGGPATAAVLANTLPGLAGFSLCCLTAHLLVPRIGSAAGLSAALAVSIGCNLLLWAFRRPKAIRSSPG